MVLPVVVLTFLSTRVTGSAFHGQGRVSARIRVYSCITCFGSRLAGSCLLGTVSSAGPSTDMLHDFCPFFLHVYCLSRTHPGHLKVLYQTLCSCTLSFAAHVLILAMHLRTATPIPCHFSAGLLSWFCRWWCWLFLSTRVSQMWPCTLWVGSLGG